MSASTIARPTITNDSGTGTDGTIFDTSFWTDIFDRIDALFSATGGITLNQAGGDGDIFSLESSDVAHGMTSVAGTSSYGQLTKAGANDGGVRLTGLTEVSIGTHVRGYYTTGDTSKGNASVGGVVLESAPKSGTTVTFMGANENIMVVRNLTTTRFIMDGDGDSHQDVGTAWTNFDSFDDPALLTALSVAVSQPGDPLRNGFSQFLEVHRIALERARLVTFNDDGHHFVNMSRLTMLLVGAVRQIAADVQRLREPWYRRAWRRLTGEQLLLTA